MSAQRNSIPHRIRTAGEGVVVPVIQGDEARPVRRPPLVLAVLLIRDEVVLVHAGLPAGRRSGRRTGRTPARTTPGRNGRGREYGKPDQSDSPALALARLFHLLHLNTISETPCRGSRHCTVALPSFTATVAGALAAVASFDASWSAAYCFSSGAMGDPMRFHAP